MCDVSSRYQRALRRSVLLRQRRQRLLHSLYALLRVIGGTHVLYLSIGWGLLWGQHRSSIEFCPGSCPHCFVTVAAVPMKAVVTALYRSLLREGKRM